VSDRGAVSPSATRRIRSFSIVVWVIGAAVMAIAAALVFTRVGWDPDNNALVELDAGGGYVNPWEQQDVAFADHGESSDTWSGNGNAVIHLDEPTEPMQVGLVSGDSVDVFQSEESEPQLELAPDDRGWPNNVAYLYSDTDIGVILPREHTVELWVRAQGDWEIEISPLNAEPIEDFASGTGNAAFIYTGEALSARFQHKGDGIFFVSLYTDTDDDQPIIESGRVDERISWDATSSVIFLVESDEGEGAWSIDIDDRADPDAADPDAEEEDAPSLDVDEGNSEQ
jgi:hypothetical protein